MGMAVNYTDTRVKEGACECQVETVLRVRASVTRRSVSRSRLVYNVFTKSVKSDRDTTA